MSDIATFRLVAPTLSTMDDSTVETWLSLARISAPISRLPEDKRGYAIALYAAHISQESGGGGGGGRLVASEKEGDLQVTYHISDSNKSSDALRSTLWGRLLADLLDAWKMHFPAGMVNERKGDGPCCDGQAVKVGIGNFGIPTGWYY